jgi:YVTN family beta-propeller protein
MKRGILLFVVFVVVMAASLVSDPVATPQVAASVEAASAPAVPIAESGRQKLYVLSSAGNDITVIDVETNAIIGSIEVGDRPHGIASPASQEVLYIATEFDNGLTVIDPVKDIVVKRYHVFGDRPNEIDVTSDGRFLYAPLFGAGVYEVFDTVEEKIVARIPTDGTPHNAVVSPDDRFVYLSPMDRGRSTAEMMERRGLPSTENNKIYVADTRTHTAVATIPTGDAPRPIAVNPDGKQLYVNIDGLDGFLVLDLEQREQIARVEYELTPGERAVPSRSHGLAVTPDGSEVWSADVNRGLVFVYDVTQSPPRQIAKLENAGDPYWMTVTPDGRTVYVSSAPEDTVTAFDVATKTRKAVIHLPEGKAPKRLLILTVPDQ